MYNVYTNGKRIGKQNYGRKKKAIQSDLVSLSSVLSSLAKMITACSFL